MKFYWPLILMLVILGIIVGMSQYAESTKERYEDSAGHAQAASITKNQNDKAEDNTYQPYKPPVWAKYVTFPEGIGAWAVVLTLLAIVWQSIETRKSAQATLLGAQASIAQVEHAKSTQRAQLRFELAPPEFNLQPKLGGYPVHFKITLYGTTRAYVLEDTIFVYLSKSKRDKGAWKAFGLPRNLTPEDSPYEGRTLIHNVEFPPEAETDADKFYHARRGEGYTLFADGRIWYRDIFGDEWSLNIDKYWDVYAGTWGPYGSGSGDTHRKVEQNKA